MERCPIISPDGRQCCRPEHAEGKHLLAARLPDREALARIAEAWGVSSRSAQSMANGAADGAAQSGSPITADRFILMTQVWIGAMADARRNANG